MSDDLSPEDALCLRIGRVARAHVDIDMALRQVFGAFSAPGLGMYLANVHSSTNRVLADVRTMLGKADLDEKFSQSAAVALDAVAQASVTRNRVVHDMWMPDARVPADSPPQWTGHQRVPRGLASAMKVGPPRDLAFLDDAANEMRRVFHQTIGLYWALWFVLPFFRASISDEPATDEELRPWLKVMRGEFDIAPDGSYSIHGS